MRHRMPSCRVLIGLGAVVYFALNMIFLWASVPGQTPSPAPCVCHCTNSPRATNSTTGSSLATTVASTDSTMTDITTHVGSDPHSTSSIPLWDPQHSLAVVVPFRNRYSELMQFVPHIHKFLTRQRVKHQIWVINQADHHRFNRAMLLNVGFILSRQDCDYFVMHDVDLLPMNDDLKYHYPEHGPLHISSPKLHPLYHYPTFVGGILMMSRNQFETVNGLSTLFWGWGREDDELYLRMTEAGMKVQYPQGIKTGYKTFKHLHDRKEAPRDMKRYGDQWKISRQRDRETGLNTMDYDVLSIVNMTIDQAPLRFANIHLECDYAKTPYCDHPS